MTAVLLLTPTRPCTVCAKPVKRTPGRGRPAELCSDRCRRRRDADRKALERMATAAEVAELFTQADEAAAAGFARLEEWVPTLGEVDAALDDPEASLAVVPDAWILLARHDRLLIGRGDVPADGDRPGVWPGAEVGQTCPNAGRTLGSWLPWDVAA